MRQRIEVFAVGFAVVIAVVLAAAGVVGPVSRAAPSDCTIAGMAASNGLSLTPTTMATSIVVSASMASVLQEFPQAVVAEQETAAVNSTDMPALDGRHALILRLDGVGDTPAGGPAGQAAAKLTTLCTVTFYDASDGEFLATLRHLSGR